MLFNTRRLVQIGRVQKHPKTALRLADSIALLLLVLPLDCGQRSTLALPVRTDDGIGSASVLRDVPAFREFTQTLEDEGSQTDTYERHRKVNMMEWVSTTPTRTCLLCLHAFGLSSREYTDFGAKMSSLGFDVAAVDVRGFGPARTQSGYKKIDFDGTVSDIRCLIKLIKKQEPDRKIIVVGESMGGAIAIKLAAQNPDLVDGVICSAPAWQICKIKTITAKGLVDRVFGEPGFAARSVASLASTNERLHKQWLEDRSYRTNVSIGEAYSYYRFMKSTPKHAERIKNVPILVVQGLNDRLSKPLGAIELFNALGSNRKKLAIVASGEHLIFEEGQLKPEVANFMATWIKGNLTKLPVGGFEAAPQESQVAPKESQSADSKVTVIDKDNMPPGVAALLKQMLQLSGIKVAKGLDRGI